MVEIDQFSGESQAQRSLGLVEYFALYDIGRQRHNEDLYQRVNADGGAETTPSYVAREGISMV